MFLFSTGGGPGPLRGGRGRTLRGIKNASPWRLYILLNMHGSRLPRACPRTPTGTHARTNTDTHAYIFSVCVLTCLYVYMHMYAYVCLHLRFFSYAMVCYALQTYRQTRTYMRTHTRKHICGWMHCGGGWLHGGRQYIYIYIT